MAGKPIIREDDIKRISVTLTDTIPANANVASGVDIATLTDNVITLRSQIKGISMFNPAPTFLCLLYYQNRLILADSKNIESTARTFDVPLIIFYTD